MEEVYVIKLKGLPTSGDPDAARKPSLYANDLSVDVTLGFACFHVVLGILSMTFGLIFLLGFDQNEWRASTEGIGCGIIFVFSGCIGFWAASERKHNLTKANDSIKIFLLASLLSILTSASFILLTAAGVTSSSASDSSRAHLIFNLTLTLLFEMFNSALSGLTSAKIIWPLRFNFYTRNWPTQSKVTKKVIVSTSIFARGLYQARDFQRSMGPNCIISLASPPPPPPRCPRRQQPVPQSPVLTIEAPADHVGYGSIVQNEVAGRDGEQTLTKSPSSTSLSHVD